MTAVPEPFGPYRLLDPISQGGMAEVRYAIHVDRPDDVVAMKRVLDTLAGEATFQRYFEAETRVTRYLRHPQVVNCLDAGTIGSRQYLALEYIHGRSLSRVLHSARVAGKRLPIPHAVFLAVLALEGLQYVHDAKDEAGRDLGVV